MNFLRVKIFLLSVVFITTLHAAIPDGYYANADGKAAAELKTALHTIIKPHTALEYYSLSTYFLTTDWNPDGYFWDMYSNYRRASWYDMNREHNMPKSWFGISSGQENSAPIGSDIHNLYPSDAQANSAKSNYPLGEVDSSPIYSNGVVKVGTSSFPGYSGTVFEPADEYKGDFARDYMYMVTCYEDYYSKWQSSGTSMLYNNTYPVFKPYAVSLLLKWSRNDQVSTKEINRNDAVFGFQHNRNPFIDFPLLAEYIWGIYKNESWTIDGKLPVKEGSFTKPVPIFDSILTANFSKPEQTSYVIKSINGISIKTGNFSVDGKIDINQLQDGIYLLEMYTTRKKRIVSKFIVRH